jgi:hypothetical protein
LLHLLFCGDQAARHAAGDPGAGGTDVRSETHEQLCRVIAVMSLEDIALDALHKDLRIGLGLVEGSLEQILECHLRLLFARRVAHAADPD